MWPRSGDAEQDPSSSDALMWRGAETPSVAPLPPIDTAAPFDDGEFDDEPMPRRSGLRVVAVLGVIGFAFAATIVTGSGGGDDEPAPPATTVDDRLVDDAGEIDEAGGSAEPAQLDESLVTDRPDVDLGLSYGGAGGGADVRATQRISPLAATPLLDPDLLPRLPTSIDTVDWSTTVTAADLDLEGSDPANVDLEIAVVQDLVVVTTLARSVTGGEDVAPGATVVLLDSASGTRLPSEGSAVETVAASIDQQAARRTVPSTDIAPDAIASRSISASPAADELTQRAIADLDAGESSVLAAEEVAQGRAVAFIGDRLVGLRAAGGDGVTSADGTPLVADWTRTGVLVGVAASDRGALLLVSDLRGRQQITIDAATGETVTELSELAWSDVYATAANGVVVRRAAAVGSVLEAVDLDGRALWQLIGSPSWAIGEGIVVTARLDASGLTVEARR